MGRDGHDPAATARAASPIVRRGTPALGQVPARPRLQDRRVRQEPPRRPNRVRRRRRMAFRSTGATLYHLDAMQQVSFPDINKSPTQQGFAPPCRNTPIPGIPEVPGAVDPKTTTCLTPPRAGALVQVPGRHSGKIQTCQRPGPADAGSLEVGRRGDLGQGRSTSSTATIRKKTNKPFFVWYNPARMHVTTVLSPMYLAMIGRSRRQRLRHPPNPA